MRTATSSVLKQLAARMAEGAAAGAVATGVMSGAMSVAKSTGLLGEPPPLKLTRKVLSLLGLPLRRAPTKATALAAHFGYGAAMGSLFGALPRRWTTPSTGLVFGLGVWSLNYVWGLPALGLMPPPSLDRPGRPMAMVAAHVVYGATLGAVLSRRSTEGE